MSRLQKYMNNSNVLVDYLSLCESVQINEMSNDTFKKLQSAGKKLGFKVKKSKSLLDYFSSARDGLEDLLRHASLYMLTDIKDSESRKEIVQDAKNTLKSINKKDVTAMLMQIEKSTIGATSYFRHVFQSIFGVEISTYNDWLKDAEYLKKSINDMRITLKRMQDTEEELKALNNFEASLQGLIS